MRMGVGVLLLAVLSGCGEDAASASGSGGVSSGGSGGSTTGGSGGLATGGSGGLATGGSGGLATGGSAGLATGGAAGDGGSGGAPLPCDFDATNPPPGSVLWAAPLSASGAATLGGHGHDDGKGPVGFCAGASLSGQPFYRLIAAGFETDEDIDKDGQNDPLPVDFWKNAASFSGVGESGGRINVYIQIVDATGTVLNGASNPEIKIKRTIKDGPTDLIPLDQKPANEFQTNFPMTGSGTRYGTEIEGASDRVINMRLPVNHHVTYTLVYRREG